VILVDVNILIYASIPRFPQHEAARDWLDQRLGGDAPVALPWPCLLGYLRVTTHPRLFTPVVTMTEAWQRVSDWLACEPVWIPEPTRNHAAVLERLLALPGIYADLVPDAHLAALAIEHGLTLCSTDRDFARFPGLHWQNPLAA
jgi:toxin-antitoxin system PIN domain toxin